MPSLLEVFVSSSFQTTTPNKKRLRQDLPRGIMQVLTEPFVGGIDTEGDLIDAGYQHWAALGGEVGGSAAKIGDPGAVVCLPFWSWNALGSERLGGENRR